MNINFTKNINKTEGIAQFHLPGLFEFYDFYRVFLPVWREHRNWFYSWGNIASIYGSPSDCIWGGGRACFGNADPDAVLDLMKEYKISARLTFSNSCLKEEHLHDKKCNLLCRKFDCNPAPVKNGVIVHSDLFLNFLKKNYPSLYFVSSTTKVLTGFDDFLFEINREDFAYVVPDFRLNKEFERFKVLNQFQKDKVEFLCNECCNPACKERKKCYENVSRRNLGEEVLEHKCSAPQGEGGYRFSLAKKNPLFISLEDIQHKYLPMGFTNFKIEGRGLGSAIILEFLLYYLTKPEFQLEVREAVYLDSMLDLF